jgi:hypothetical protein
VSKRPSTKITKSTGKVIIKPKKDSAISKSLIKTNAMLNYKELDVS